MLENHKLQKADEKINVYDWPMGSQRATGLPS